MTQSTKSTTKQSQDKQGAVYSKTETKDPRKTLAFQRSLLYFQMIASLPVVIEMSSEIQALPTK